MASPIKEAMMKRSLGLGVGLGAAIGVSGD
jgi:hypothetical protein